MMGRISVLVWVVCGIWVMQATAQPESVSPGVTYESFTVAGPNQVFLLRIERSHPDYALHLAWPNRIRNFAARQKTSEMAALYDNPPAFDVIAAVNGSFSGDVIPEVIGPHASDGELQEAPDATRLWETLIWQTNRQPVIVDDIANVIGTLWFANGSKTSLHRYNRRGTPLDTITAFTPTWGPTTGTEGVAVEVVLENVTYPMRGDKELSGTVAAILSASLASNNPIPPGGMVLSATGVPAATILQRTQVGDRLRLRFATSAPQYNNVEFAITGAGWILREGQACTSCWTQWAGSFTGANPRTMIGWNATHLMLVVVDGRQPGYSVGMTFAQMADLMLSLGATECLNIDGGGSSTMVVHGAVMNSPSDPQGERPRNNAVLLVRKPLASSLPFRDDFDLVRASDWQDKFNENRIVALEPSAPGGDGRVMRVLDPTGGAETLRRGYSHERDYTVDAWVRFDYRPDLAFDGFERTGIFAREAGLAGFTETTYGGGNAYAITFDSDDGRVRAGKLVDGALVDLLPVPRFEPATAWRRVRIDCYGQTITYWLDGEKLLEVQDTSHAAGQHGIGYHELFATNSNMRGAIVDRIRAYVITPGDLNCDGDVTSADIDPFVLALSEPAAFEGNELVCPLANGDLDRDGLVTFDDIDPFMALLSK